MTSVESFDEPPDDDDDDLLSGIFDLDSVIGSPDPLIGTVVGDAKIVRLIGQGGMSRVYEGIQASMGRTVAVKVLRPGLVSTPGMQRRIKSEAEILTRLRHPGIVQTHAVGVHMMFGALTPYLITEFIPDARTLTRYADDLQLPAHARLALFKGVCDAVAYGHEQGVELRNLQPTNILVDAIGQPKVIDFGLAKAVESDCDGTTMETEVQQLIGAMRYMSPEQMQDDPNRLDGRCGVYALGVVLHELLTGRPPYDIHGKTILEVIRSECEGGAQPISAVDKTIHRDVVAIVAKCLKRDRDNRYSSPGDLRDDVARHLAGEPITARPPGFIEGIRGRISETRRRLVATLVSFVRGCMSPVPGAGERVATFGRYADELPADGPTDRWAEAPTVVSPFIPPGVQPHLSPEEVDTLAGPDDMWPLDDDEWRCLDLTTLSVEQAESLVKHGSPLYLDRLHDLSPEAAKMLVRQGWLSLGGLTTLSDETAEILAQHEGTRLYLRGLTTLSKKAARMLRANERIVLPAMFR